MLADLEDPSVYVGDIMASDALEEHLDQLNRLQGRIKQHDFHMGLKKAFFPAPIQYLGLIFDELHMMYKYWGRS